MQKKLSDICQIRTGITLRKGTSAPNFDSRTHLIGLADINDITAKPNTSSPIEISTKVENFIINTGDILFATRGTTLKASVMPEHSNTFLAPSHLCILTLNELEPILPHYLALFLISNTAERFFQETRRGSAVQLITKSTLSRITIPIPSIAKQEHIIALHFLIEKEQRLHNQIQSLHKKQLQYSLNFNTTQNTT